MNLSGILVLVPPAKMEAAKTQLSELPGVDVHHQNSDNGRIVVTLEADSVEGEVEGLKRIQALPPVIAAEMVYHYFEGDEEPEAAESADPESENE